MVTHELTVFPDGRIDGAFSVREGDYNSHTLRFVLTQDLTAASAKLLLWPAGAEKPTVYGVLLGHGQAAGQDVQFTPVSWGKAPSRTQIQLELLDNNGNIIWQSRRLCIPVEPGIPDDALPEPVDTSDATAGPGDVALGKTFYAQGEKKTGSYVSDGIRPRAWADIPIDYIKGKCTASGNEFYFQRIDSTEFMLVFPNTDDVSSVDVTIAVDTEADIYRESVKVGAASVNTPLVLAGVDFTQPVSLGLKWGEKEITISVDAKAENNDYACLEIIGFIPAGYLDKYVTRKGEVFRYYYSKTSAALIIRAVRKYSSKAILSQHGRIRTAPVVGANERFAAFELISPDGRYRKKYCVCKYDADATTVDLETYAYPAKAFVDGDLAFYDYTGAGFTPADPQPTKAEVLAAVTALSGEGKGTKGDNGKIQLGAGKTTSEDISSTDEYFIKNALADILEADFNMSCVIGAKSNVDSVGILGKDTLTEGSRWMVFVNDWLVDMPGFLENVWPSNDMRITLFYTCADGLDVGYPYAGE